METTELQWEHIKALEDQLEIETRLRSFFRKLDPYSRALVFSIVFFFACIGIGILFAILNTAFFYSIFIDALTVFIALAAYSRQARSLMTALKGAKELELFTIAETKARYPKQDTSTMRIVAWEAIKKIFWTSIVQRFPSFAYVRKNQSIVDRRWMITSIFTIIAVLIWVGAILVVRAYKIEPGKEGIATWLIYTLYLALITILAIPFAMLPPDDFTGIAEQCWFVFRSHIVYDIPIFYAAVAFSYSLFFSSAQRGGIGWFALFQAFELSFVVFFMGVLSVTLLDTSITIWTILNSGQLKTLDLMTSDSHGGLGSFYSLNNWNTALLGVVAIVQASKLVVSVLLTPGASISQTAIYTIPAMVGVPLLMTLTWAVSVFFLHKRIVSIKESMIKNINAKGGSLSPENLHEGNQSEGLFATRDRIMRISSWPRASSFIATALSIIAAGLSFAYPYIIKPLLAALGIPV